MLALSNGCTKRRSKAPSQSKMVASLAKEGRKEERIRMLNSEGGPKVVQGGTQGNGSDSGGMKISEVPAKNKGEVSDH